MHRFYVDCINQQMAVLSAEDSHHALKVLRLSRGDTVEVICQGKRYRAILKDEGQLKVLEELSSTEAALRITLFQGLPKADKMDWIVQKAVEIGVHRIVPVIMSRCVVRLSPQDGEKKQVRWARIAREAGKQSGRCILPEISSPVSFQLLPSLVADLEACVVPWEEIHTSGPLSFLNAHPHISSLGILIGPEGGISPSEITALKGIFQPLTLGPRILRTETAGLAAAAAFLALRGEMEHS